MVEEYGTGYVVQRQAMLSALLCDLLAVWDDEDVDTVDGLLYLLTSNRTMEQAMARKSAGDVTWVNVTITKEDKEIIRNEYFDSTDVLARELAAVASLVEEIILRERDDGLYMCLVFWRLDADKGVRYAMSEFAKAPLNALSGILYKYRVVLKDGGEVANYLSGASGNDDTW